MHGRLTPLLLLYCISCLPYISSTKFTDEFIKFTNKLRDIHGSPPLLLDSELSKTANDSANKAAKDGGFNNPQAGENSYMMCTTYTRALPAHEAVTAWYDEVCNASFSFTNFTDSNAHAFTQLVWKDTSKVGVAKSSGTDKEGSQCTYVVAVYRPAGNIELTGTSLDKYQLYEENVEKGRFNQTYCDKFNNDNKKRHLDLLLKSSRVKKKIKRDISPVQPVNQQWNKYYADPHQDYRRSLYYRFPAKFYIDPETGQTKAVSAEHTMNPFIKSQVNVPAVTGYERSIFSGYPYEQASSVANLPYGAGSVYNANNDLLSPNSNIVQYTPMHANRFSTPIESPFNADLIEPESNAAFKSATPTSPVKESSELSKESSDPPKEVTEYVASTTEGMKRNVDDNISLMLAKALKVHNALREIHNTGELRLVQSLNDEAEATAQANAASEKLEHSKDLRKKNQGENLAFNCQKDSIAPIEESIKDWYKEVCAVDYDFDRNGKKETKHFTQIVWKDTTELGCGRAIAKQKVEGVLLTCVYYCCKYRVMGNIMNEYPFNVLKGQFDKQTCNSKMNSAITEGVEEVETASSDTDLPPTLLPLAESTAAPITTTSAPPVTPGILLGIANVKPAEKPIPTIRPGGKQNNLEGEGATSEEQSNNSKQGKSKQEKVESQTEKTPDAAPPKGTATEGLDVTQQDQDERNYADDAIKVMNEFREIHNAEPLLANEVLQKAAKARADSIVTGRIKMVHRRSKEQGEIMEVGCNPLDKVIPPEEAVTNWYREVCSKNFKFGKRYGGLQNATHFTQVVWKNSKSVGIAYATKVKKNGNLCTVIVAKFDPSGNNPADVAENVKKGRFDKSFCGSLETIAATSLDDDRYLPKGVDDPVNNKKPKGTKGRINPKEDPKLSNSNQPSETNQPSSETKTEAKNPASDNVKPDSGDDKTDNGNQNQTEGKVPDEKQPDTGNDKSNNATSNQVEGKEPDEQPSGPEKAPNQIEAKNSDDKQTNDDTGLSADDQKAIEAKQTAPEELIPEQKKPYKEDKDFQAKQKEKEKEKPDEKKKEKNKKKKTGDSLQQVDDKNNAEITEGKNPLDQPNASIAGDTEGKNPLDDDDNAKVNKAADTEGKNPIEHPNNATTDNTEGKTPLGDDDDNKTAENKPTTSPSSSSANSDEKPPEEGKSPLPVPVKQNNKPSKENPKNEHDDDEDDDKKVEDKNPLDDEESPDEKESKQLSKQKNRRLGRKQKRKQRRKRKRLNKSKNEANKPNEDPDEDASLYDKPDNSTNDPDNNISNKTNEDDNPFKKPSDDKKTPAEKLEETRLDKVNDKKPKGSKDEAAALPSEEAKNPLDKPDADNENPFGRPKGNKNEPSENPSEEGKSPLEESLNKPTESVENPTVSPTPLDNSKEKSKSKSPPQKDEEDSKTLSKGDEEPLPGDEGKNPLNDTSAPSEKPDDKVKSPSEKNGSEDDQKPSETAKSTPPKDKPKPREEPPKDGKNPLENLDSDGKPPNDQSKAEKDDQKPSGTGASQKPAEDEKSPLDKSDSEDSQNPSETSKPTPPKDKPKPPEEPPQDGKNPLENLGADKPSDQPKTETDDKKPSGTDASKKPAEDEKTPLDKPDSVDPSETDKSQPPKDKPKPAEEPPQDGKNPLENVDSDGKPKPSITDQPKTEKDDKKPSDTDASQKPTEDEKNPLDKPDSEDPSETDKSQPPKEEQKTPENNPSEKPGKPTAPKDKPKIPGTEPLNKTSDDNGVPDDKPNNLEDDLKKPSENIKNHKEAGINEGDGPVGASENENEQLPATMSNFMKDGLLAINSLRSIHGSTRMKPNKKLIEDAKVFANVLAEEKKNQANQGRKRSLKKLSSKLQKAYKRQKDESYGQNSVVQCFDQPKNLTADEVVLKWWSDEFCENGPKAIEEEKMGAGSQLVWNASTNLGMDSISFKAKNELGLTQYCSAVIALYLPKGNIKSEFQQNVKVEEFDYDAMCEEQNETLEVAKEVEKAALDNQKPSDKPLDSNVEMGSDGLNQKKFADESLNAHNTLRAIHTSPPLTMDENVSKSCYTYAKKLAAEGTLKHESESARCNLEGVEGCVGENLAYYCSTGDNGYTGDEPVRLWYGEACDEPIYDFQRNDFIPATGHFTQVVWKESTTFGVGYARGEKDGMTCYYAVARYAPPGNLNSKIKENVLKGNFMQETCDKLDAIINGAAPPTKRRGITRSATSMPLDHSATFIHHTKSLKGVLKKKGFIQQGKKKSKIIHKKSKINHHKRHEW